jgi:hypothetical protein
MPTIPTVTLSDLVLEARQYPVDSPKRQRLLTEIIRQMQRSGKIWHDLQIPADQYQEALQRTWLWFCQSLHNYDPSQSHPITWFNCTLKFRIKDVRHEVIVRESRRQQSLHSDSADALDLIDRLPAPPLDQSLQMLTALWTWLDQQQSQLEQMTIRDRPDVNAYILLMRRLPIHHQATWQELSAEFGVAVPTLSSFYQRHCLPLLREFGQAEGWLGEG